MTTYAVMPIVALDNDAVTRVNLFDGESLVSEADESAFMITAYSTEGPDWQNVLNVYAKPSVARQLRDALTEALDALDGQP